LNNTCPSISDCKEEDDAPHRADVMLEKMQHRMSMICYEMRTKQLIIVLCCHIVIDIIIYGCLIVLYIHIQLIYSGLFTYVVGKCKYTLFNTLLFIV